MQRCSLSCSAALLLLLLSLVSPASAQSQRRWLADPELLTRQRVIGSDGRQLTQVPDSIIDIALVDSQHGWATSYSGLLRFDGRFWRPAHSTGARQSLVALDLRGPDDGWAVGSYYVDGPPRVLLYKFAGPTPPLPIEIVGPDGSRGELLGQLKDIDVLPDGSAVAVGYSLLPGPKGHWSRPLVLSFDGSTWRDVTPELLRAGTLDSITMVSAREGWIAGRFYVQDPVPHHMSLLHFKAGSWTVQQIPIQGDPNTPTLDGLAMRDAGEGWAVYSNYQSGCRRSYLLHYTNGTWSDATPANLPLPLITELALIPGTNRGWASLASCDRGSPAQPELRVRFDNGNFTPDQDGARLVPDTYALLSDEVQWAAAGGAMLRYSTEALPTARVNPVSGARYFEQTGHTLAGAFRDYYERHGLELGDPGISDRESLALLGYPISEPFDEINPDTGAVLQVQYFQRARMEYHPDNPDPYKVLLGRLGANRVISLDDTYAPVPMVTPECQVFVESPYPLCPPFRDFWNTSGGLPVFGFPLTPLRSEQSQTDGATYQTQWFERERLEHHPEHRDTPYEVQLGLLAAEELRERGYLPGN